MNTAREPQGSSGESTGVTDAERRALSHPQRDSRGGSEEAGTRVDESGKAKDDPSRAPESGTP